MSSASCRRPASPPPPQHQQCSHCLLAVVLAIQALLPADSTQLNASRWCSWCLVHAGVICIDLIKDLLAAKPNTTALFVPTEIITHACVSERLQGTRAVLAGCGCM